MGEVKDDGDGAWHADARADRRGVVTDITDLAWLPDRMRVVAILYAHRFQRFPQQPVEGTAPVLHEYKELGAYAVCLSSPRAKTFYVVELRAPRTTPTDWNRIQVSRGEIRVDFPVTTFKDCDAAVTMMQLLEL